MEEPWGILIKWDRKGSEPSLQGMPDHSIILHPRYLSDSWTGVACFCSHDHIQLFPQSGHALTPVQLSASHTYIFLWVKLLQVSPPLKARFLFPISDCTHSLPTALLHLCAHSTCWLNTDAKEPFSTGINKIEIINQEPSLHPFLFFPTLWI